MYLLLQVNPDTIGQMDAGNSEAMMILSSRVGLIIGVFAMCMCSDM